MSHESAVSESRLASSLEADFARAPIERPATGQRPAPVPETRTVAINNNGSGSLAAAKAESLTIRHDAADRLLANAREENAKARKAVNELETQRAMKRAECQERFRVKAEELMRERERELQRIELEFDTLGQGAVALLSLTNKLVSDEVASWKA